MPPNDLHLHAAALGLGIRTFTTGLHQLENFDTGQPLEHEGCTLLTTAQVETALHGLWKETS